MKVSIDFFAQLPEKIVDPLEEGHAVRIRRHVPWHEGCQMAKFDPFLSLDCARVEGVGAQSKERKGSNFAA